MCDVLSLTELKGYKKLSTSSYKNGIVSFVFETKTKTSAYERLNGCYEIYVICSV